MCEVPQRSRKSMPYGGDLKIPWDRDGVSTGSYCSKIKCTPGASLYALHLRGHGIAHARVEQFRFPSGFLGGPKVYVERHRHANVREKLLHVAIDGSARDAWLKCLTIAIDRFGIEADLKATVMSCFTRTAERLVTRPDLAGAVNGESHGKD